MGEYVPAFVPARTFSATASAAITGGQVLVASGSGTVAPSAAASAAVVGVAGNDTAPGQRVTVWGPGVHEVTASGAITAGQTVEAAAGGQVAAHTNGTNDLNIIGVALTTAAGGAKVRFLRR